MSSRRGGTGTDRLRSSRGTVVFAVAVALVVVVNAILLFTVLQHPAPGASGVVTGLQVLAIPATCGRAAWRATGRTRSAWLLMTTAGVLWSLGEISWGIEHYLVAAVPTPAPSEVLFLLALVPAAAALLVFPALRHGGRDRLRTVLGALVVGLSVLFISQSLALPTIFSATSGAAGSRALTLAFPVSDILLAGFALSLLIRTLPWPQPHLVLVALGLLHYAIGDTVYFRTLALGRYEAGTALDVVWSAGYALFSLAALAPRASELPRPPPPNSGRDRSGGVSSLVVYVPMLVAVIVAAARPAPVGDPVLIVSGVLTLVLFGFRQAIIASDNGRLRHDLELQVGQLKDSSAELRQLGRQNERVLQSVVDGVLGVDADGQVTFVNERAATMLGRRRDEIVGTDERELFAEPPAPGALSDVRRALASGSVVRSAAARFRTAQDAVFPVELAVGPVREGLEITGAVVVFRDVSARLAVEKMKNEFISVVSHELRTPLTAIRGSLGLLVGGMGGNLTPTGSRMVTIALESSERLTRLIEDMLDLERIESGALAMASVACRARDLVSAAVHDVAAIAALADITVTASAVDGVVAGDPDRIVQVLTNLLSNAVKFSPHGGEVVVSSRVRHTMVEFTVTDRGRGIPADKTAAVFDRFEQVDSSDAREHGGTGLGLTISRDIVDLHGGRIWVVSELGSGSTFRFTVPCAREQRPAADHMVRVAPGGPVAHVV